MRSDKTQEFAAIVAQRMSCPNDDYLLECMKEKEADSILELFNGQYSSTDYFWGPVIDNVAITGDVIESLEAGRFHKKDIMIGYTKNEGSYFDGQYQEGITEAAVEQDPEGTFNLTVESYRRVQNLNDEETENLWKIYAPDFTDVTDTKSAISDILGDISYVCPTNRLAKVCSYVN